MQRHRRTNSFCNSKLYYELADVVQWKTGEVDLSSVPRRYKGSSTSSTYILSILLVTMRARDIMLEIHVKDLLWVSAYFKAALWVYQFE